MAQHDFVPAWLNFSTPQTTKVQCYKRQPRSSWTPLFNLLSIYIAEGGTGEVLFSSLLVTPAAVVEKHGEHLPRGEGRYGVNRRRHNSSDGFFNNGPLKTAADCWNQPSLLRHDSVDSAVAKGTRLVQSGPQPTSHGPSRCHDAVNQRSSGNGNNGNVGNGSHRHWNGNFPPRKNSTHQEKQQGEIREEKDDKKKKLQFEDEDFPSLNPDAGRPNNYNKPVGTPSGVWENPPSAKQPTKMLVIKKISKDDPVAFSAAFASPVPHLSNGSNKSSTAVQIVYKNLVPKPAAPPSKAGPWKTNGREPKQSSFFSSRDSAFTSPLSVTKPAVQAPTPVLSSPKESPSSITPPIEMNSSRLTRLTRRSTDKKSEFLRALKDESSEEMLESREYNKLEEIDNSSIPELKERDILSHSLEAEHRLLKAMGWQEYPENDENCLPLTEEELQEFHMKSEQLRSNTFRKNGIAKQCNSQLFLWRSTFTSQLSEDSEADSTSSDTSDDDA